MAFITRQSDYRRFSPETPIVIDNGGSTFRIGWAGESDPRITFRNAVQRPCHRATGETVTIVGDRDPALMKYFDCTRSSYRSPFDNNVVYQFEIMEYVLDYGFERLGSEGSETLPVSGWYITTPSIMCGGVCTLVATDWKLPLREEHERFLENILGEARAAESKQLFFGLLKAKNAGFCY